MLKIITLEELLDYRIDSHIPKENKKGKAKEFNFQKELNKELKSILEKIGYKVEKISKEQRLIKGICDFLVKLKDNEYLIIECKTESDKDNRDLKVAFAIGQLLAYRTAMSIQYNIPKEKIHLMIASDIDSLFTLSVIGSEEIDVDYITYKEGNIKYYGRIKNG